jgi:hypothetical protein
MLWTHDKQYETEPFELEADLEEAVKEVAAELFGPSRIYLDVKKKIGAKGKVNNIPDGYLLDLSSTKAPKLFVVENELACHEPLKHVAVQILEFSLSFETSPLRLKTIVKQALKADAKAEAQCSVYASANGFDNIDYLLERMINGDNAFNALVIIDELDPQLETALISRFQFPVEIVTLQRFVSKDGGRLYQFAPFLADVAGADEGGATTAGKLPPLDPAEIDTIVVPAQEDGFQETFIGEDCWYAIRIHASMIPKIKHIAVYRVAPTSAVTHVAEVKGIEPYKDTGKYIVHFAAPATKIDPIKLVPKSVVKAPYSPRYTSLKRLTAAKDLNEAF